MNQKVLIGIIVLLLGAGAGWYLLKQSATPAPVSNIPEPTASNAVITGEPMEKGRIQRANATYTAGGFNPKTITVKVGTTVAWTNQNSSGVWVASAVHPTHQLLPGFDALKSYAKGETYEYTFVKVGSWKYHNHLNPSDTGSVEVTP